MGKKKGGAGKGEQNLHVEREKKFGRANAKSAHWAAEKGQGKYLKNSPVAGFKREPRSQRDTRKASQRGGRRGVKPLRVNLSRQSNGHNAMQQERVVISRVVGGIKRKRFGVKRRSVAGKIFVRREKRWVVKKRGSCVTEKKKKKTKKHKTQQKSSPSRPQGKRHEPAEPKNKQERNPKETAKTTGVGKKGEEYRPYDESSGNHYAPRKEISGRGKKREKKDQTNFNLPTRREIKKKKNKGTIKQPSKIGIKT